MVEALAATNISKEMLERMGGQMKLWQHEGQFVDPRVLHLSAGGATWRLLIRTHRVVKPPY